MKLIYTLRTGLISFFVMAAFAAGAQVPTTLTPGNCAGVVANFNTGDNGFNSPSIYGSIFDSSFYFHAGRGYWTDYLPPFRIGAPGFPRVLDIISPPFNNPNPVTTFNVGFYYIVNNPATDRFQVRIISVTPTPQGTVTNVEATSGVQFFSSWSTPTPYLVDNGPDPTPFLAGFQGNVCLRMIDPDITNAAGTTYRVEVAYLINDGFFTVFDNLSIGPSTAPLPVDFIGLVANKNTTNNSADLRWDVSEEINVREYRVERSDNGTSFTTMGTVSAKGKSIYSYTNQDVPSNTVFYRIKSVDIDGHFKYSGIIKLAGKAGDTYADKLMAYPVPATDQVTVSHKKLIGKAKLTVTTLDGRILKSLTPSQGSSHTFININDLTPGIYIIRLEDETGDIQSVKLIKTL